MAHQSTISIVIASVLVGVHGVLDTTGSVVYCWSEATGATTYQGADGCGFETLLKVNNGVPRNALTGIVFTTKYIGTSTMGIDLNRIQYHRINQTTPSAKITSSHLGVFVNNQTLQGLGASEISALPFLVRTNNLRTNFTEPATTATNLTPGEQIVMPDLPGDFIVLAKFSVADLQDTLYHFITLKAITSQYPIPTKFPVYDMVYDGATTYCWETNQTTEYDRLNYYNGTADFSSNCPINVNATVPLTAPSLSPIPVTWEVSLKDTTFPGTIVNTAVHICSNDQDGYCHILNQKPYFISSADLSGNFNSATRTASFASTLLSIPTGLYIGFIHVVIQRTPMLHLATYFQLKVDDKLSAPATEDSFALNTTYCWKVYASTATKSITTGSILGSHSTATSCPLAISFTSMPSSLAVNQSMVVSWSTNADISDRNHLVELPLGWSIASTKLVSCNNQCSPFTSPFGSLSPLNASTNGSSAILKWSTPGVYSVYAWATVNTLLGTRVDVATFASVTVNQPVINTSTGLSKTTITLITTTSFLSFILLTIIIVLVVRRRKEKRLQWTQWQISRAAMYPFHRSPREGISQHSDIPIMNEKGIEVSRVGHDPAIDSDYMMSMPRPPKVDLAVEKYLEYPSSQQRPRNASNASLRPWVYSLDPTEPMRSRADTVRTQASNSTSYNPTRHRSVSSSIPFDPTRRRTQSNPQSFGPRSTGISRGGWSQNSMNFDPTRPPESPEHEDDYSIAMDAIDVSHYEPDSPRSLSSPSHARSLSMVSSPSSTGSIMATYGRSNRTMRDLGSEYD
ncbi:hypothetical protein THRCLA_22480 [Thraustotheca clavata]|uniref:Secreted protein n=1 Tax=Thraustotheca clavata TaxID=74557 RepID=A0A1V9Z0C5_9STRA|nr:hypothetical protein THRCLA_22480 [Thraustotheca clavata]